ncbi:MAG: Fe-S-containing protein [Clostridia bacterium]|nr:Fe-S-containing protein [Clostridia bacterium]
MSTLKNKKFDLKTIAFFSIVLVAFAVIVYFTLGFNKEGDSETLKTAESTVQEQSIGGPEDKPEEPGNDSDVSTTLQQDEVNGETINEETSSSAVAAPVDKEQTTSTPTPAKEKKSTNQIKAAGSTGKTQPAKKEEQPTNTPAPSPKTDNAEPSPESDNTAIIITKSEIASTAKFFSYRYDGITMEVIAVKASDGTIRTALNTCQVCYDSGKGYYEQIGDYLVCQNCGNRFHVDQVENVKGGCNPVPITGPDKQENGNYITISKDFMASQKEYFLNWKKY